MRSAAFLLAAVALAACSRGSASGEQSATKATAAGEAKEDDSVRCALAGAKDFKPDCTRETSSGADGEIWIVRHPDGGFRRFVLIDKGARIASADGSEEVQAKRVGPDLEVRIANDRYLFPAAPETPVPPATTAPHATAS